MQPCIIKCTNAVQMYLAVINEMYPTSQPFIMKCTKALQMYLAVIIIRLALVIHIYSKFGTHIIIVTSLIINCQRHNFLQSTELFLSPLFVEIINKQRYLLKLLINGAIFSTSIL